MVDLAGIDQFFSGFAKGYGSAKERKLREKESGQRHELSKQRLGFYQDREGRYREQEDWNQLLEALDRASPQEAQKLVIAYFNKHPKSVMASVKPMLGAKQTTQDPLKRISALQGIRDKSRVPSEYGGFEPGPLTGAFDNLIQDEAKTSLGISAPKQQGFALRDTEIGRGYGLGPGMLPQKPQGLPEIGAELAGRPQNVLQRMAEAESKGIATERTAPTGVSPQQREFQRDVQGGKMAIEKGAPADKVYDRLIKQYPERKDEIREALGL